MVDALNASTHAVAWRVLGFAADDVVAGEALQRLQRSGQRVLGTVDVVAEAHPGCHVVVAIGDPLARADVTARAQRAGLVLAPALVHPSASVGFDVLTAPGVVIQAGSHLTTNVLVGTGVQLNLSCVIGHDVELRDHATLGPGCCVAGGAVVGHGARLGVGVSVAPGVVVGAHARIGAGVVVVDHVPTGEVLPAVSPRPAALSG